MKRWILLASVLAIGACDDDPLTPAAEASTPSFAQVPELGLVGRITFDDRNQIWSIDPDGTTLSYDVSVSGRKQGARTRTEP